MFSFRNGVNKGLMIPAIADATAHAAGRPFTSALCLLSVVVWAVSGPFFGFSEVWQIVINTATTIVTFLMVFLLQATQNRDGAAIQAKLDELIRASDAENRYIGIDHLTEENCSLFGRTAKTSHRREPLNGRSGKLEVEWRSR